jgi:hypothetical protein
MFGRSFNSVGGGVAELYVEFPGGWKRKVRFLEPAAGSDGGLDLLLPDKMSASMKLRLVTWLQYSANAEGSERDFASSFLGVVNDLSAGRQGKTYAVLWIARGVGEVECDEDGVSRWRRFHVAGQVMRGGTLVKKRFELGQPGWNVVVDTRKTSHTDVFWKRILGLIESRAGGGVVVFTVIRNAALFKRLVDAHCTPGSESEECCEPEDPQPWNVPLLLEESIQAELSRDFRTD